MHAPDVRDAMMEGSMRIQPEEKAAIISSVTELLRTNGARQGSGQDMVIEETDYLGERLRRINEMLRANQ